MAKRWSLQGKTVLVTGAARGIGAETAKLLAARGAQLALVGLEFALLRTLTSELGSSAACFEADVSDKHAVQIAVNRAIERFGGIDVVVSNAGVAGFGTLASFDVGQFERTIAVNLTGTYHVLRACLPQLIARRGYFLANASIAAGLAAPGMGAYSASKAGVEALCDTLRTEVKHHGVDVGIAYFSWIATHLVSHAETHPGFNFMRSKLPGFLRTTTSVPAAAAALVGAIEQRRERVVLPASVRALLALRWPLALQAGKAMTEMMPELERLCADTVASAGGADKTAFSEPPKSITP